MTTIHFKLLTTTAQIPTRATEGSTCFDLYADLTERVIVQPRNRELITTGVAFDLEQGWEVQIRPRSGLAYKHGIVAHWGSGDSDYRGPIGVILFNHSDEPFYVDNGMRIAQVAFAHVPAVRLMPVAAISSTTRGVGGFGHTGT